MERRDRWILPGFDLARGHMTAQSDRSQEVAIWETNRLEDGFLMIWIGGTSRLIRGEDSESDRRGPPCVQSLGCRTRPGRTPGGRVIRIPNGPNGISSSAGARQAASFVRFTR